MKKNFYLSIVLNIQVNQMPMANKPGSDQVVFSD